MVTRVARDATVAVGTSSTELVAGAPDRDTFTVTNRPGNAPVWLRPMDPAIVGEGFLIDAGNAIQVTREVDGSIVTEEWYAIADGASATVAVVEQEDG